MLDFGKITFITVATARRVSPKNQTDNQPMDQCDGLTDQQIEGPLLFPERERGKNNETIIPWVFTIKATGINETSYKIHTPHYILGTYIPFGQRTRRGRCPIGQRGEFSVRPNLRGSE